MTQEYKKYWVDEMSIHLSDENGLYKLTKTNENKPVKITNRTKLDFSMR